MTSKIPSAIVAPKLSTASATASAAPTSPPAPAPRKTKASLLHDLVGAPGGARLSELMAATGWQAHTVRAALSGLRKQGYILERRREGCDTIYSLAKAADHAPTAIWNRSHDGARGSRRA